MKVFPFLSVLTAVPLIGAITILGLGDKQKNRARILALVFSFIALALILILSHGFDSASGQLQFQELHAWIPSLGAEYHLGIDGLGLVMLLLSALVVTMSIAASSQIRERESLYFSLVLFLQAGLFGTFTALNFFHWFIFWELSLIPAFFLIQLWGGPRRAAAATQFFVYTMVGSVALLLSFLALFHCTGTFDFLRLSELAREGQLVPAMATHLAWHRFTPEHIALLIFGGVFLGFAVKVPLVPLHTWLPSTYAEAPTGTTMLLTGAMSKMGVYGFLRIVLPIFAPQLRSTLTVLLWLAVSTVVLSAFAALAQKDLKRIFAYSSINHLGYCMLGIFAVASFTGNSVALTTAKIAALDGVILQVFNHALIASALFWFVALLETRTGGLRGLNDFGGLRRVVPVFTGLMGIALFASLGLPGLNGFIGEFLIFRGVFPLAAWAAALSLLGLLVTAIFILTILQRVFSGPLNERWSNMPDLTVTERLALFSPIALMFALGVFPQLILGIINSTVMTLVQQVRY
ncbi:MAG TPA: NADH-quinone oxidoreductase subunit M [Acidobacteriaceae bacterium]|nr:NADH-quinone oxidoreductase subunit M [Acidobacteriaceae bacterium]